MSRKVGKDLLAILPTKLFRRGCRAPCTYKTFEKRVQQYLEDEGCVVKGWHSLEADEFGPTVRGVYIDGQLYVYRE